MMCQSQTAECLALSIIAVAQLYYCHVEFNVKMHLGLPSGLPIPLSRLCKDPTSTMFLTDSCCRAAIESTKALSTMVDGNLPNQDRAVQLGAPSLLCHMASSAGCSHSAGCQAELSCRCCQDCSAQVFCCCFFLTCFIVSSSHSIVHQHIALGRTCVVGCKQ